MTGHGRCSRADKTVTLRIGLGRRMAGPDDLAQITRGTVVELSAASDDDVDVYVGARLLARGQAVVVDGKLAVRMGEILDDAATPGHFQSPAPPAQAMTQ